MEEKKLIEVGEGSRKRFVKSMKRNKGEKKAERVRRSTKKYPSSKRKSRSRDRWEVGGDDGKGKRVVAVEGGRRRGEKGCKRREGHESR